MIVEAPWFDHEHKLPNRPLYRTPEALALWRYTVSRPLIEGIIMSLKVLTNLARFLAGVVFIKDSEDPAYYIPLGLAAVMFGVSEAVLSFWKEIAPRVHRPGVPIYHQSRHI